MTIYRTILLLQCCQRQDSFLSLDAKLSHQIASIQNVVFDPVFHLCHNCPVGISCFVTTVRWEFRGLTWNWNNWHSYFRYTGPSDMPATIFSFHITILAASCVAADTFVIRFFLRLLTGRILRFDTLRM